MLRQNTAGISKVVQEDRIPGGQLDGASVLINLLDAGHGFGCTGVDFCITSDVQNAVAGAAGVLGSSQGIQGKDHIVDGQRLTVGPHCILVDLPGVSQSCLIKLDGLNQVGNRGTGLIGLEQIIKQLHLNQRFLVGSEDVGNQRVRFTNQADGDGSGFFLSHSLSLLFGCIRSGFFGSFGGLLDGGAAGTFGHRVAAAGHETQEHTQHQHEAQNFFHFGTSNFLFNPFNNFLFP